MAYKYKVFISYRRENAAFMDTVYDILKEYIEEKQIFVDKERLYDEPNEWPESLDNALKDSEYIIICVNKHSFIRKTEEGKTDWYYKEIFTALERKKKESKNPIILAVEHRMDFTGTKFEALSSIQDVNYQSLGKEKFREKLLQMVGVDVNTKNQREKQNQNTIIQFWRYKWWNAKLHVKMEKPTTIIYGNQYNFGDINGGTQNFCNIPKEKIKFGVTIPENLVPRRDMLDRLEAEFASHKCVVVSGIGGSGKTSLAYLYAKEKEFNNIIWITVNGKIEDVFVDRIAAQLFKEKYEMFSKIEDKQTKLDIIKNELSNIAGNNLLVLDINSNNDETKQEIESDLYNYLPANYWKTLVLTRTKAINTKRFATIEMNKMTEDEAVELFKKNYGGYIQFSDAQLADIAQELYFHPLLIEQTAIVFSKGHEKSADEIITKIKDNSKVNNPRTKKILRGLAIEDKEQQDIYTYLINLCNIENLSEDEIGFLAVYVTWPEEPINYEVIETLLSNKDDTLDSLVEKGILSRNSADQYTIHSLIADVLREQIEIENHDYSEYFRNIKKVLDDDIESMLLHKYSKCIASSFINYGICEDIVLVREFLNNMVYNGDPILYNLPEPKYSDLITKLANNAESYQAAHLYNAAARVEKVRYHLQEAKSLFEKGLEVMKGLEGSTDNLFLKGGLLNNLALLEENLGELDAAKEHYKEAIEIDRNLPESPENRKSLATGLNNLAMLEEKLGDLDAAKKHYKEAIEIDRKLPESPENSKNLANHLNNLAGLEENLDNFDAAKKHYKEAIEIMRKLPESPENLYHKATILGFFGQLDTQLGDIDAAKEHYKEALEIAKQIQNEEYIEYLEGELSRLPF